MKKSHHLISWILQIVIVVLIAQTLPFKFSAHPDSVALFTSLDMEPHGRIMTGVIELIACILLLIPVSSVYGALLAAGLMSGALIGHITKLGFSGSNGVIGVMAIIILVASLIILFLRRAQLPIINRMFSQ